MNRKKIMSLILTTAIASNLILSTSTTTYAETLNNVTASETSEKINITNENLNTEASSETIDREVNSNDEVNEIINIPDTNLKTLINNQLGQNPTADITKGQALEVTVIMDHSSDISNLEGLQYFTNLTELILNDNQISDISSINSLIESIPNINIDFSGNPIAENNNSGSNNTDDTNNNSSNNNNNSVNGNSSSVTVNVSSTNDTSKNNTKTESSTNKNNSVTKLPQTGVESSLPILGTLSLSIGALLSLKKKKIIHFKKTRKLRRIILLRSFFIFIF